MQPASQKTEITSLTFHVLLELDREHYVCRCEQPNDATKEAERGPKYGL